MAADFFVFCPDFPDISAAWKLFIWCDRCNDTFVTNYIFGEVVCKCIFGFVSAFALHKQIAADTYKTGISEIISAADDHLVHCSNIFGELIRVQSFIMVYIFICFGRLYLTSCR